MSRSFANSLYAFLLLILLVLFWGRLSQWIEMTLQMDATITFITTIALLAVVAALNVRFVRARL
jgi:hypothetical protein